MTCLSANDVAGIPYSWDEYDRKMASMLKTDLISLAARAVGNSAENIRRGLAEKKLAVVKVTSGGGVIPGFSESVVSIGLRLGMNAAVMYHTDGAGFEQAEDLKADIIISADDKRYIAREQAQGRLADNNPATSAVFVSALELLCGGSVKDKEVIVLGLGPIGRGAATKLIEVGAYPLLYDIDHKKSLAAISELPEGEALNDINMLKSALKRTNIIFDASPAKIALEAEFWPANPIVSAPGVPLAWPMEWMNPGAKGRLWHDVLESGTAAMLAKLV